MEFLANLINGMSLGSVYAIIALGYTMVYGIAKMLNFAHGDVIMIGAYISFVVTSYMGLPAIVSVLAAAAVCTALGILIEGLETAGEEAKEPEHKKIPLTAEEEAYLKNYLEELPVVDEVDADSVFEALAAGDQRALQTLTSYYMKTAADMAVEMNIEEMQLADLIQEANLCLIQALGTAGDECRDEKWLLSEMRKGIQLVLEEQTQRKFEDDSLVARVEKLEHAVRDLNDGEDEKNAFTIDELAIILDMKVDEIRDILRLTGDDN